MELSGARILVEELVRHGVRTVFGYPGGAVLDIYDELARNASRISHVLAAHEQGAAHAADGYARVSGRPGVVLATSGPGACNLVTGIASAYMDSVPLVAITGNVASEFVGTDSFQEVDIVGITQPVVKHNFIVRDVAQLERVVVEAFAIATSGRKGPVLIDIPKDVQSARCDYHGGLEPFPQATQAPAEADLAAAAAAVRDSQRPFIYCGSGVVAADAAEEVMALSERIGAPVGLSMMGLSAVPASYSLNLGMSGTYGTPQAARFQGDADLIIAIGARFSDRATGDVAKYQRGRRIIHIDIDAAELGKNVGNIIEICGDAREVLQALLVSLPAERNEGWAFAAAAAKQEDDEFLSRAFGRAVSPKPPTCAGEAAASARPPYRDALGRAVATDPPLEQGAAPASAATSAAPAAAAPAAAATAAAATAAAASAAAATAAAAPAAAAADDALGRALSPKAPLEQGAATASTHPAPEASSPPVDSPLQAADIIRAVRRICDDATIIATDVGQHQMWVMRHYGFMRPRTLLTSGGLGAMGFGLGAAIGGCIANAKAPSVLFTGDGSFGMSLQELATAVSQELPILIVVFNNGTLGMVRQWQDAFFGQRRFATTLERRTDFVTLAQAFGAAGRRAKTLEELEAALASGLPKTGPVLIDCLISPDEYAMPVAMQPGTGSEMRLA